jgi:hypothetical protein
MNQTNLPKLQAFTEPYRPLFKDQRLYEGFQATLWGILASGSCCVNRIASASPLTGTTAHAERRIRRLIHGQNRRALLTPEVLSQQLSEQGAKRLAGDHEVLLMLDASDLRKPYANRIAHLDTVRSLEGTPTRGFLTLTVLGIGQRGQRALLYHACFSTRAPDFKSLSACYLAAIDQVTQVLTQQGVGRCIWVLDRGFDNLKVIQHLQQHNQCFVIRAQHHSRQATACLGAKAHALAKHLHEAPEVTRMTLERLVFDPQAKRRGSVEVALAACALELTAARGLPLTVVQLRHEALDEPWFLLSNLRLPHQPTDQAALAQRLVQLYRQRWAVEELFKWTKAVLAWEQVQLLDYQAFRTLVAFAWLAAAFLFDLGMDVEDPRLVFLASLGGWTRNKRPPGKQTLARGLAQLCSYLLIEQHLQKPQPRRQFQALVGELFPTS